MTVVEDYASGLSLRSIASATGRSRHAIKAQLAAAGIAPRGALAQRQLNTTAGDVPVTAELAELIDGLMLGDGGIELRPGREPRLHMTNAHRGYVDHAAELLRAQGVNPWVGAGGRGHWRVVSRAWPALAPIAARWYVATHKRAVPDDLRLTPTALMHWWLGDGGLAKRKGKRPTGYFYTNSFPRVDVERLVGMLHELGISATANRCGGPQNHEWRIHLSRAGVLALVELIGPCPVPSYGYKWNVNEVHPRG